MEKYIIVFDTYQGRHYTGQYATNLMNKEELLEAIRQNEDKEHYCSENKIDKIYIVKEDITDKVKQEIENIYTKGGNYDRYISI